MLIRKLIFIYSVVACITALVLIVMFVAQGHALSSTAAAAGQRQAALEQAMTGAQSKSKALEADQQAHRADYSPQEAVENSFKAQEAKSVTDQVAADLAQVQKEYVTAQERAARVYLLLVPVIAIGLLHIILVFMFRPRRDETGLRKVVAGKRGGR
jgi:H+/Cl- antiporter ClcA